MSRVTYSTTNGLPYRSQAMFRPLSGEGQELLLNVCRNLLLEQLALDNLAKFCWDDRRPSQPHTDELLVADVYIVLPQEVGLEYLFSAINDLDNPLAYCYCYAFRVRVELLKGSTGH